MNSIKNYAQGIGWAALFFFVSGTFNGGMDAIDHKYPQTIMHQNGWNPSFWDPDYSWVNKWAINESGGPMVGVERFPGSSTVFVMFTDAWHLLKFVMLTGFAVGAVCYGRSVRVNPHRRKWWHFLIDIGVLKTIFSMGFWVGQKLILSESGNNAVNIMHNVVQM